MKKALLFLFLSLAMMGCKKEQKENQNIAEATKTPALSTVDCKNNPLMRFLKDLTHSERIAWLEKYGDAICLYELYDCVEEIHNLESDTIFIRMAEAHTENQRGSDGIKFYSMPWDDITKFITDNDMKCYEDYIGFFFDTNNEIKLKKMKFSDTETSYSAPLFEGIRRVRPNAKTVYFTKAIIPLREKSGIVKQEGIIFKMEDSNGEFSYYDISDNPTKKDLEAKPTH